MHAGPKALDNTTKHSVGVTLADDPLKMPTPVDEPCLIGKGHKTAKDAGPSIPANLNLFDHEVDEICVDFHGPYPQSKRGNVGFYNFVASDTNAEVSIAVKSTSEFETAYRQARMRIGKPKYLRMDNQQNLVSNSPTAMTEFEANRLKEGTRIRRSPPGHQEQNGLAEVAGKHAYQAVTAQLADAGLPHDYWDWGIEAYSYVKSRTGMEKHYGKTPYEMHTGIVPYVGHLRSLFCPAFPAVDKEHRQKPTAFTSRVKRCIFVGYPTDQKPGTYLLLNLETKRVITSRDVYFDENFRFVERQADNKQWLFRMDKGFDTFAEDLTFAPSDDIEAAFDAATCGSVGDGGDVGDAPVVSNRVITAPAKMGRSQLDGLIRSNPNLRVVGSKRPGTAAGNRFAKYKTATSVQQFFWLGGTRADLKHDIAKGIVTIEGDTESDDDDEDDEPAKPSPHVHSDKAESEPEDNGNDHEDIGSDHEADNARRSARTRQPPPTHPPGTVHADGGSKKSVAAMTPPINTSSEIPSAKQDNTTPEVLKTYLKVDFSMMDKHFHEVTAGSDERDMNEWKDAFQKEMDGVVDSSSLSVPMKLPRGKKALKVRVIGKKKSDGRKKWRMVPKGYMQTAGADYDANHIDAPVVDKALVRSMIAIGNRDGAHMRMLDIVQAFLNAELVEEVYMYAPPGIDIGTDDEGNPLVFRLLRAVYGLKQSPAAWNDLIDEWLKSEAPGPLTQNPYDRCFFSGWRRDDYMMLSFHVDDFLIVTTSKEWENEFMTAISSRFDVKDLGALGEGADELLGLDVKRTRAIEAQNGDNKCSRPECPCTSRAIDLNADGSVAREHLFCCRTCANGKPCVKNYHTKPIVTNADGTRNHEYVHTPIPHSGATSNTFTISSPKTLRSLLDSTGMTGSHPTTTPAVEPAKSDLVGISKDEYDAYGWEPASVVGSAQWCATNCRPDLTVISSVLGSERHDPTVAGMKNMERMLRYVSGTVGKCMVYSHSCTTPSRVDKRRILELVLYADSDWAGDIKVAKNPQSRSRGGHLLMLVGCAVHWQSKLRTVGGKEDGQSVVDLSSASAEIGAQSEGCRRMIWLKRALISAGFEIGTVKVYADNTASISFAHGQTLTERTRHIHRNDSFVREMVRNGEVEIEYIKSENNLADFFTKILPLGTYRKLRDLIMGLE